jgi:hypothetical protein
VSDLAQQALDAVVHQFAHPLDFVRELVQNAIDAGSQRVVVRAVIGAGDPAMVRIAVEDAGEGMDEARIDGALTRLFATTKAGDLTRIGRYGIGFASVFAVSPDAVEVITGRGGEAWEVWFHADRTFEKRRLDHGVAGTTVRVWKSLPAVAAGTWVEDCRTTLDYWCEHPEVEIAWVVGESAAAQTDDPFAIAANPPEERIGGPLAVDAPTAVAETRDGREVIVGYLDPPRYGFYARGMTLVATSDAAAVGAPPAIAHRAFKVRDPQLGHTLARDGVRRDDRWEAAMAHVAALGERAIEALLAACEAAVRGGAPLGALHRHLAAEGRAQQDGARWWKRIAGRRVLRATSGKPVAPAALAEVVRQFGAVLLSDHRPAPVAGVLEGNWATAALVGSWAPPGGPWETAALADRLELVAPCAPSDALAALLARVPEPPIPSRMALRRSGVDHPVGLRAPAPGLVRRGASEGRVFLDCEHPLVVVLAALHATSPRAAADALALALAEVR